MNKSRIEWCDYTWNPVTGCKHGCSYCYAARMCQRFAGKWDLDPADPFKPTFHPERLNEPLSIKKPSRIFVGSMCDLFGDWVEKKWIENVIVRADIPPSGRHAFMFLTKNPKRYAEFKFWPNCWLGVTVTGGDKQMWDILKIAEQKNNIRFVSYEPILGSFPYPTYLDSEHLIDWLILGALTGPGAKKYAPRPEWISDAVERCRERGIPIFMKDSIRPYWNGELIREFPK
jgi:protein gp37